MNQEKLTAVENKIRDLVPRLRELGRGKFLNGEGISWGLILDENFNGKVFYMHGNQKREISITKAKRLLVVEPTLEDVLEACYKLNVGVSAVRCSKFPNEIGLLEGAGVVLWIPGKPLSEQSEETIEFLHSLFFKD